MAAFYVLAALLMRSYTDGTVGARHTVWPTWGWALGMGSALLWFLAGLFACCARPLMVRACLISMPCWAPLWLGYAIEAPLFDLYYASRFQRLAF